MGRFWSALLALAWLAGANVAIAQTAPAQPVQSPILTLDQDRLFAETLWGKRAAARIEAASADLAAENRRIETDLTAEEKALTEKRASMPAEEFRTAADAFDAKVTEIRHTQDAKARAIGQMQDTERQRFYAAALPVMGEVLRSRGAVAVLDSRAIFLAADVIDITGEMVARIDASIGAGEDVPMPAPADGTEAPGAADDGN
ncbi:OmpH family outer membrane protein [Defluviimonas sp. SAOS-178_SWC]|uniref:OmpH family outer membrane protein n=1 Tax=Defluviimonas sp. SAOS-178_SWC TaxID=3121287 RepID=UPI0032213BE2